MTEIGIALSEVRDTSVLLKKILTDAKELTRSDGATVYTVTGDRKLHFELFFSDTLDSSKIHLKDLSLDMDNSIACYAVNHKKIINIPDIEQESEFDFSGAKQFDEQTGYRTQAVLTIPLFNHEEEVVAVLQLINPIEAYGEQDIEFVQALASQASIALSHHFLIQELKALFRSLIRMIAEAIDEKSPSTGHHGRRVPILTRAIAESVSDDKEGVFKEVHFSDAELDELDVAAFLHDAGKITTPVHLIEKSRKLETIFDRIKLIEEQFEHHKCVLENQILKRKLAWFEEHAPQEFEKAGHAFSQLDEEMKQKASQLDEQLALLQKSNEGSLQITDAIKNKIQSRDLLSAEEIDALCIERGNLTAQERQVIEHHIVMTHKMLSQLKFPKDLKRVPEIASSHHEHLDGTGYPRGLTKEQLSLQARILAIADVFEALSAPDRSYKKPLPLSQVFQIMQQKVERGHLDGDLFEVFLKKKAYLPYARDFLAPEQIDV